MWPIELSCSELSNVFSSFVIPFDSRIMPLQAFSKRDNENRQGLIKTMNGTRPRNRERSGKRADDINAKGNNDGSSGTSGKVS